MGPRAANQDSPRWDERHAQQDVPSPDPWLRSLAPAFASLPPGPVLDVACGLGQNTLWVATVAPGGWRPHLGVDASPRAVARATRAARERGARAAFELRDVETHGLPGGVWSAALVFHFLDRNLFPSLERCLSPGGLLACKTHLRHRLRGPDLRPKNPRHLLEPGELLWSFPSLKPLSYREWADPTGAYAALLAKNAA